ncbi:hypothetical protein GINT2_001091 [Glugoides intestinalis]
MFCLSYLLPGALGKFARKITILAFLFSTLYIASWVFILKGLDFKVNNVENLGDKLILEFLVKNTSFGNIDLIDLDFYNHDDEKVPKITNDLPLFIKRFSSETLKIAFLIDQYHKVELTVKVLGLKRKFKVKMNGK